MSKKILIIDDEKLLCKKLEENLSRDGYDVISFNKGEYGIEAIKTEPPDLILLDLRLPDIDGLKILEFIKSGDFSSATIMMTGHGSTEDAVSAIKLGAYDFIEKPFSLEKLRVLVRNALDSVRLKKNLNTRIKKEQQEYGFEALIGDSHAVKEITDLFRKLSSTDPKTILITGDSGTGKGLAAKVLHYNGARADKPFIELNCAAIPETLLESELFGYEAGSFTDAKSMKTGILEDADGGTIFLDEIGDMSLTIQAKLVKSLEERKFRRIGGKQDIKVDVRVVAATNKDLRQLITEKLFREDLYHRLNVISVEMPSLKDRKEDIELLTRYFLGYFNADLHKNIKNIPDDIHKKFMHYDWPGNVRELRGAIERAVILSEGDTLDSRYIHLQDDYSGVNIKQRDDTLSLDIDMNNIALERVEEIILKKALELNSWNQTKTAEKLGITRQVLRTRMINMGLLE